MSQRSLPSYLAPYRGRYAWLLLATFAGTLIGLSIPYVLRLAIDAITAGTTSLALARYGLAMVGLTAIAGALRFVRSYGFSHISRLVEYRMRNDLLAHLQRLPASFFQTTRTGDLMARMTNDLNAVRQLMGPGFQNFTNTVVSFVITLAIMFGISFRLALYASILLPVVSVVYICLKRQIERRFTAVQEQFSTLSAKAQENFSGIRVVKAFAQEDGWIEHFRSENQEYVDRAVRLARIQSILWPAMQLVVGLPFAMVIWLGGQDVIAGRLTLGEYVQFNGYLTLLVWPMIALGWTAQLYQQGIASLRRLQELFEIEPSIVGGQATPEEVRGEVELRGVSFGYGPTPVLRNLNLHVPARGSLGIVGHTGAGKTSLVQLLLRLYDATQGQVLVDGLDVREWQLDELRRIIGYVPQETFLFSESLAENIALGVSDAAVSTQHSALRDAVRASRLENDLPDFPHGLETVIGERGVTLSGGQKQRTAIARALMKDPRILILDDALSSVDTSTAEQILSELRQVMRDRTTIIVSHRISVVRECDEIVVLRAGEIVERGAHMDLIRAGGEYARIYRRQLLREELDMDQDVEGL
ncbi:MAG TPA: ABC transporter ATP-binding protein [Chloroflexota bacterium]|nr:ABC transporter ATP-binding protein [Chloroflexota bacterium]